MIGNIEKVLGEASPAYYAHNGHAKLGPVGLAQQMPTTGSWWASPAGPQLGVPIICLLRAYAGPVQLGPDWVAHHLPIVGICLARPTWPQLGVPIAFIYWASLAWPRLGWPTICPQWANGGPAHVGPGWGPAGHVGPSFAQHGPTRACCLGSNTKLKLSLIF